MSAQWMRQWNRVIASSDVKWTIQIAKICAERIILMRITAADPTQATRSKMLSETSLKGMSMRRLLRLGSKKLKLPGLRWLIDTNRRQLRRPRRLPRRSREASLTSCRRWPMTPLIR